MNNRSHVDAVADYLLPQPIYATELLACVRRDGDVAELALLLRRLLGVPLMKSDVPKRRLAPAL